MYSRRKSFEVSIMNAKIMVTTYFVCKKLNINRLGKHGNNYPIAERPC